MSELNVLLIVNTGFEGIGTVRQHVDALMRAGCRSIVKIDVAAAYRIDFSAFDAVVLHWTVVIASRRRLLPQLREKIALFRGLKILFIQDEYRWIDATAESIRELGIGVVFSLVQPDVVRQVYRHPFLSRVRFEYTLTGFVSDELVGRSVPAYEDRRLDVVYRARRLTAWHGSHTLQKWQIADAFLADAQRFGLSVDISTRENDRIYGDQWFDFLANARACLGTESGASVLDYTGEIQRNVEAHLARSPQSTFEELRDLYFKDNDGKVVMNVISPRCFEAAALRSLMIMYPGDYGGILEPGRHYVVLERDHSNIEEVVRVLRTPSQAKEIIDRAYREIAASGRWNFQSLTTHFERVLTEEGRVIRTSPVSSDLVARAARYSAVARRREKVKYALAVTAWTIERWLLNAIRVVMPGQTAAMFGLKLERLRLRMRRLIVGV